MKVVPVGWCRFLPKLRLPRSLESLSLVAARVGSRLFANESTVQQLSFSLTVDPLVLASWQLGLGRQVSTTCKAHFDPVPSGPKPE